MTTVFNSGGGRKKILWKNPNPTSGFARQTVDVPMLKHYMDMGKEVYVTARHDAVIATLCTTILTAECYLIFPITRDARYRPVIFSGNDSVLFGNGSLVYAGGTYDNVCVPQEIYVYA